MEMGRVRIRKYQDVSGRIRRVIKTCRYQTVSDCIRLVVGYQDVWVVSGCRYQTVSGSFHSGSDLYLIQLDTCMILYDTFS